MRLLVAAAIGAALAGTVGSTIRFEEIASRSGLNFTTENSPTPNKNQPETMVAGVAVFDYDRDGDLDVYFTNGAAIPSLKKDSEKHKNRLFRNEGGLKFTDVTDSAGAGGGGYGMGVAAADYDNDGFPDLYLANVTENILYRNNGNGTFTDVTAKAGVAGGIDRGMKMWTVAAGWFDYNKDGRLDLFLSNYCKWEVNRDPVCPAGKGLRAYCHPRLYESLPDQLYRNNGDGTFTDVSAETGISRHLGKGMGVVFNDYDRDGWLDVFVANDNMPNFLFHNIGGKKFEEVALEAGVAFSENGKVISGMGADFKDLDNDGLPDIWHTAIELETFPLFLNRGKGVFEDFTARSRLARYTIQMSGWSNGAADFDNDGWKDLFVARSNVLDNVGEMGGRQYPEPNAIFRNLGKTASKVIQFESAGEQAGPDFQQAAPHRGVAMGDLDNDGRIDLVVTVLGGKAKLFHNTSENKNHWITFDLTGTKSNRMAIGAQVKVTGEDGLIQHNIASPSTGYGASSDPRVHFGLGGAARVKEVEIRWPSGVKQVLANVEADRIIKVDEPAK